MRRALFLSMLLVSGCDFAGAFRDYCAETGRCDGGSEVGGGGGATGGGGGGGGTTDAGAMDGGSLDGGAVDGGADSGVVDSGVRDSGVVDAGFDPLSGAGQGDGGVMPGCEFNHFNVGGFTSAEVNDCTAVVLQALKPDPPGGGDVFCNLPMDYVAVPDPGFEYFGNSSCTQPPTASDATAAKATRFGTYRWYAGVTNQGFTISTRVQTFTAQANLVIDGGTYLTPGVCNYLEVSATGMGLPAPAAATTRPSVTLMQGGTGLSNCGALDFQAGNSSLFIGVNPAASTTAVTVRVSGPLFINTASVTVPMCKQAGGACVDGAECCSQMCQTTCL